MKNPLYYKATAEDHGKSLAAFLRSKGCSEKLLRRLKKEGLTVNNGFHRLIDPLQTGDVVKLELAEHASDLIPNPSLKAEIRYEDDYLVVYDKPADMLVHPGGKGFDDALANLFVANYPGCTFRPMGRLDRNTTGLCLAAKNSHCANLLNHTIDKTYFAIAEGHLPQISGVIDAPLLRIPGEKIRYTVDKSGLWAVSYYHVLQKTATHTLVEVKLLTGRTHQIRAHFSSLGYPLAGDLLYGGSTAAISRQALHCGKISFFHPIFQHNVTVESPLPQDMAALLK